MRPVVSTHHAMSVRLYLAIPVMWELSDIRVTFDQSSISLPLKT